jgi:hypothetical protein
VHGGFPHFELFGFFHAFYAAESNSKAKKENERCSELPKRSSFLAFRCLRKGLKLLHNTNTDDPVSDFKKKNRLFEVWIPSKLMTQLEKELKTFDGGNQKEQFITFWNWYFHAKEMNNLLKPENKEELPQDPDAPKCKYHAFSGEQWYCNREKIPKEVCLQTYRNFRKNCLPRRIMEKRQIEQARQENPKHSGSGSSRSRNYIPPDAGKRYTEPDVYRGDT